MYRDASEACCDCHTWASSWMIGSCDGEVPRFMTWREGPRIVLGVAMVKGRPPAPVLSDMNTVELSMLAPYTDFMIASSGLPASGRSLGKLGNFGNFGRLASDGTLNASNILGVPPVTGVGSSAGNAALRSSVSSRWSGLVLSQYGALSWGAGAGRLASSFSQVRGPTMPSTFSWFSL